jgi:hypothetical protein
MTNAPHWHRPDRTKCCISCGDQKPLSAFYAYGYTTNQGKRSQRYESRCVECARARRLASYAVNGEQDRAASRRWKHRNRDHLAAYSKRKQQDPAHRALKAKSQRLRKARMRSGQGDTPEIRAIYAQAIREQALIQRCPVFDIPELGKKLHVDHRIPLAKGGLHAVSNLQILPIGINMRKGVSCPR